MDIVESEYQIILVHPAARNLAADDLAEDAVFHAQFKFRMMLRESP
jgi:hypothetical protein